MPHTKERVVDLPPFPSSWYGVLPSASLAIGQVRTMTFCGEEVVLYRTASGNVHLAEAHCPHMGAHLGHGGTVQGEDIRCPFHGFCFDGQGKCTATGYGTKPPPQALLKQWPVQEVNGMIFAWHGTQGESPDWAIPALEWEGWTEPQWADWRITSHPQEIAENSVDIGHFRAVHGYDAVKVIQEAATNGPVLEGIYGMSRIANFIGKGGKKVNVEFKFQEHGLGFAYVHARVLEMGLNSRHFVLPMPIDGKDLQLRIGVSVKKDFIPTKIHPLLGVIPKAILLKFIKAGYYREYKRDVSDDFRIWQNKVYVHPPFLAQGDGPVILYRKWAQQFY